MKKDYDYYVNRKNTPHLDLYTKLIGMFYFWNGMNFILGSVYALSIGQKKLVVSGLFLGILMCSLIKDKTTDKRKNQRDLKAVIGDQIREQYTKNQASNSLDRIYYLLSPSHYLAIL